VILKGLCQPPNYGIPAPVENCAFIGPGHKTPGHITIEAAEVTSSGRLSPIIPDPPGSDWAELRYIPAESLRRVGFSPRGDLSPQCPSPLPPDWPDWQAHC
jgi:hypothetical protein